MPSRAPPKAYHVLVKTHKLTVFLTAHPSTTVAALKQEALCALTSSVLSSAPPRIPSAPGDDDDDILNGEDEVPRVQSTKQFELCRAVKDKGKLSAVAYEVLDPSNPIQGLISNWEWLYVQFRDEDGNLLPVQVSRASLLDEEEEDVRRPGPLAPESPPVVGKGKRKAPPE